MSARHHVALVGAAATLLASSSMLSIYATWTWLFYSALAVGVVVGSAMIARALRAPVWTQAIAMLAALTVCLTVLFPSGTAFAGLIPTPSTFAYFGELLSQAGAQMRGESIPVPDLDGLLMVTTLGIGAVAFLVDLCAVGLRRPALTGLPMLAIYSVPVAVLDNSVSIFPFALGAAGYMWLLVTDSVDRVRRFGRRFTGDGRDIDLWEPSPLAAAGRRLGLVGVAVALLVPLAVPAMSWSLFSRFGGAGTGGDGSGTGQPRPNTGQVDLVALLTGSLQREQAHVMVKVTTNDPAPYYLRFAVADTVTNKGFANGTPSKGRALDQAFADNTVPTGDGVRSTSYHAAVETVDFNMRFAPIYLEPTAASGLDADWVFDSGTNQLYARKGTTGKRQFQFDYVRSSFTADALRRAGPVTDPALQALSAVPHVRQIDDLVTELIKGQTTQYDKVLALYKYFGPQNHFLYSLAVPPGDSGNPIVDFLTGREGFCVQYAAALAWLVREAGFPARVAFGFTRGNGPNANGVYELTNFNLHAWTEVYFSGFGWVPFDATPSGGVLGSVQSRWAPNLENPNEDDSDPGKDVPAPNRTVNPGTVGPTATASPIVSLPGGGGGSMWPWLIGGAVVLLIVVLLSPALRRAALRRRRLSRSGPVIALDRDGPEVEAGPVRPAVMVDAAAIDQARQDAHEAWAELLDTLIDFAIPVDLSETPRATGDRLGQLRGLSSTAASQARLLASAEERARYARLPLGAEGLDGAVAGMRAALAGRATRRQRLSAAFMPRSVVLRWKAAWFRAVATTVARVGRVRDRVVGVLSPRRLVPGRR